MSAHTYMALLREVMGKGVIEPNNRTGISTKRLFNARVQLTCMDDVFVSRKLFPKIAAAEVAWMLSGRTDTDWLSKHTSIWKKFEDKPGFISTAYGHRWMWAFQRNQVQEAIDILKKDPSTRQALVMSWDPRYDGLMNQGMSKNVPCPFAFSLYISQGVGYVTVYQRSADVVVGIPYDLMAYYMLGQAIFNSVGVRFASVCILIGDAHVYENHWGTAELIAMNEPPHVFHRLDHGQHVSDILDDPDRFVKAMGRQWEGYEFPIDQRMEAAQ